MHPPPRHNRVPSKLRGRARARARTLTPSGNGGPVYPRPVGHFVKSKRALRTLSLAQLTEKDQCGRTVLHTLAREGRTELAMAVIARLPRSMAIEFVNARSAPDAPGCGHRTALHVAALYNHGKLYFALCRAGADPTLRDRKGRTPRTIRRIMAFAGRSSIGVAEAAVATPSC